MIAGAPSVLLVEDEPAHAEAIRRAFAEPARAPSSRCVVVTLREYREAVDARPPDIALVDLNLPDGRAIEVLTSPAEAEPFPIVVMTSYGDEQTAVEAMKAGALDYVVKSPEAFADMPRIAARALREWGLLRERRHAADALRHALGMQEAIFEGSRDAIFISDADSRFVAVNAAACELTGYSAEELLSMRIPDLHEEADLHAYETHHDSIMAGAEILSEAPTLRKDGCKLDTEFSSRRFVVDGAVLMHTTARNITARKRARRELQESEERYQSLARVSPVGIFRTDEKGATTYVNPSWCRISGMAVEEALGDGWLNAVHPDDREGLIQDWRETSRLARASFADYRLVRPNGAVVWVMGQAIPETNAEGEVVGYIGTITDITERKRAEEALRESEERYRQLVEMESDALLLIDNETGRILEVNGAAATLYGFTREELLAMKNTDLSAQPEETQRVTHGTPVISDQVVTIPLRIHRKKDGTEFPVEITGRFFVSRGRPVHIAAIRDITERQQAQDALRVSERRYRLVVETANEAIIVAQDGMLKFVNPIACSMLGYTEEELTAIPFAQVIAPEDRETVIGRHLRRLDGDAQLDRYSFRVMTKGGTVKWVEIGAAVIEWEGRPATLNLLADITVRIQAEAALQKTETFLRMVLSNAPITLFTIDEQGRFTLSEGKGLERVGLAPGENVGTSALSLFGPMPFVECSGKVTTGEDIIRRVLAGETVNAIDELRGVQFDNYIGPMRDAEGKVIGIVGVATDITERKRAENELEHSRALLFQAQKMEAVGRLAGGVAHDFNNILQTLLSLATVLRLKVASPELARIVAEIEAHIKRGAGLTQQLLLFSRRQVAERKRVDLGELVSVTGVLLRRLIPESIRLTVDTTPERLWVEGDAGQLQQVLMNLAVNAKDAMPAGGTLTIRTSGRMSEAVVEVIDTGQGMDEETRSHLFEPFFTTKEVGKGTGLGLSVVHGIVEQHGGLIEVESSPGEGSLFRVVLPTVAAPDAATKEPSGDKELPRGEGARVLVVEDEDGARKGLVEILEFLGYEVTALGSGEEAGVLPDEPAPDLLLTDLVLPGIDGAALAAGLRDRWPHMKTVLMSGYTEDEAVRRGVNEGDVHFLQKPFDMAALALELHAALGSSR